MTALEILTRWIDRARYEEQLRNSDDPAKRALWRGVDYRDNLKAFWIMRDILEYPKSATVDSMDWSVEYLRTKCKPSPDRETLEAAILAAKEKRN